jgi:hypothetical protein
MVLGILQGLTWADHEHGFVHWVKPLWRVIVFGEPVTGDLVSEGATESVLRTDSGAH